MDYLQYSFAYFCFIFSNSGWSFKPYYKWITFNTIDHGALFDDEFKVLNLIINGLPSILKRFFSDSETQVVSFKPYYKWITFNTLTKGIDGVFMIERSLFYMVAKIEHFSVFWGF